MSQVIVIDSSEEDGTHSKETMHEETVQNDTKVPATLTVVGLFLEFCELCEDQVKDDENGKKILKFLCKKHGEASEEYKSSRPYRKLLQSCISKLKNSSKDVYVHVHNIISVLDRAIDVKSLKHSRNEDTEAGPVKKRKISLENIVVGSLSKEPLSVNEGKNTGETMENFEHNSQTSLRSSEKATSDDEKQHSRIKKLELLLKRMSKEIQKLQSVELSLDDLDQEDTSYVQESRLKRRFMKVYNELCRLNKSSMSTGRVMEKKITVTASRFVEVNHKVERFINNPKRSSSFPDFADIYHLIKQANYKSQLRLSDSQIKGSAVNIFEEVGDKMQKRRHQDFVFEFGCSVVDDQKDIRDPAQSDNALHKKLSENRLEARCNLDAVIDKFTKLQQVIKEEDAGSLALQEDNEGDSENEESGSDVEFFPIDSEILNSDEGECSTSYTVKKAESGLDMAGEGIKQDANSQVLKALNLEAKT